MIDRHLARRRKNTTMKAFSEMTTTDCNLPKNCNAQRLIEVLQLTAMKL